MEERITVSKMSRRRFFKRTAKHILYSDWIGQILAFFIVGAVFTGIYQFGISGTILVDEITGNYFVSEMIFLMYLFLAAIVFVPMLYGLMSYEINAVEKGKGNITDIFSIFSSPALMLRSYLLSFYLFFKTFLCFLPAFFAFLMLIAEDEETFSLSQYSWHNINYVYLIIETIFVAALFFGFVLSIKQFVGAYICVLKPEMKIRDAFFAAKMCCHGSRAEVAKLMLSFLPLMWFSLYTAGLLFVMYSLPYMMIAFVLQSKYLYEKEIRFKNVQKILYASQNEN